MKTIDLLVQELPALGGFPDGAVEAGFLCSKDTLYFVNKDGDCPSEWRISMKYDVEDRWVEVTREQYEAALAAKNDGWIEWGGGKHPPVSTNTVVDVKLEKGYVQSGYPAGDYSWEHVWQGSNIIAYRLHQPQEVTEADDESDLNECIGQDAVQVLGGEGKPAIGEKCEHHSGGQWEVVTIAGIYENLVTGFTDYWMVKEDGSSYTVGNPYRFRPIRSEADKMRDEAAQALCNAGGGNGKVDEKAGYGSCWFDVYDAIAAGKIPGVKLDD